jgi:CHAT domain-containing protein/tetratricopeptide (TPR) repeat protein
VIRIDAHSWSRKRLIVKAIRAVLRLGLLVGFGISFPGWYTTAQTIAPKEPQPPASSFRKLTVEEAKRAAELERSIESAVKTDRWTEAIALAEEQLALQMKVQGPKHFETVNADWRLKALRRVAPLSKEGRAAYQSAHSVDEQASNLYFQGKYAAAQPLYEKALEIRRQLLTEDHPDTAVCYNSLAFILYAQGKYPAARPLFEKALEIDRRLLGEDHPNTANSYNNLASNLIAQGQYATAQPLLEKALAIRRRLLTDDDVLTATSYNNLAYNLKARGQYAAAQPLFEKALEIRRRLLSDDHPDTAISYNNVASNLNAQGQYASAQPLLEKVLEIRRRLLSDDHPDTAVSYNNLAFTLNSQGKYTSAQPLYEKALEINRRLLSDEHPNTANCYNNVAVNLKDQGLYASAQPLFEKALEIRRRLLTDDHHLTALTYNNVAVNLDAQGKHASAEPLFEKALKITCGLLTDNHPQAALCTINLADNLDSQGQYASAENLFAKALEIRRRLLTDNHPDTAIAYYSLGRNLAAQGKYREARDRWLAAVKSLNVGRLQAAFTGLERAGVKTPARSPLATVLARLGQPAQAWQYLEEDLGRGLLDELAARQDRRLAPGERARLRELTAELERLDRLVETTPRGLDQAGRAQRFEDLKHQRELASVALGEFQAKLVQDHGPLAGQVASLEAIQAALPADAALVAWVDIPPIGPNAADPDGEHWGVVVRSRGIPAWVPIAGTGPNGSWTGEDTNLASRVRAELRNRPGSASADLMPLVERLRARRLEPMASSLAATTDGLPPARTLIVLLSPDMAAIPVEVLLAPGDRRIVSYAPSATVFKYLREQPRPDRRAGLLALGAPVFDHRPDQLAIAGKRKLEQVQLAARSGEENFAPLPGTRHEVEVLARLFQALDRPTQVLLGTDASEPELDRLASAGELARYGFIHLATHGVIDEAQPVRSAVILTQTGLPDPLDQVLKHRPVYDGRLSVREIQRSWDLKAELVTLSACETARGQYAGGEGFVGFTQALLMSGARSVCLSLWKVDDKATALLMTRFYQNLLGRRGGLSGPLHKAEALDEAKRWLRNLSAAEAGNELAALDRGRVRPLTKPSGAAPEAAKPSGVRPYEHPYYWAAFVLAGDPD